MNWRRRAMARTACGVAGSAAMALALPGTAFAATNGSAAETRYELAARGDAFYFQVDGDEIPASPKNDSGSLTAAVTTTSSGGSKAFAGSPYYGATTQTLPGTVNAMPNQYGHPELQLPFSQFPGYVDVNSTGDETKKVEEGQYYRIGAEALPTSAKASGYYGAPAALPAPNQQQTAIASTQSEGGKVVASATGSSQGFVQGPLEVADSTAIASISQVVGEAPSIEGKTFGRFSVAGQEFGFDQNGFRYLGQQASSKDSIAQANSALKAANMELSLAPAEQEATNGGGTRYTIGGLKVTTTQASPSGAGNFTFSYIIGRATISADVADLSSDVAPTVASTRSDAASRHLLLGRPEQN